MPTVRRWYEKFRDPLPKNQLFDLRLSNNIQIDEVYRGKNEKSYSIIGSKQTGTKQIAFQFLAKNLVDC